MLGDSALLVARTYRRGLLPKQVAKGLFWRLAHRSPGLQRAVLQQNVRFGDLELVLRLPMRYHQNWFLFFRDLESVPEAEVLSLFRSYAARSGCTLDVGMHVGLYLYTAAAVRPANGRVYGFEPDHELASAAKANIARNGLDRVEVVSAAISNRAGPGTLLMTDVQESHTLSEDFIRARNRVARDARPVTLETVDRFVAERGLTPELIKVDVEGHELEVIAGARDTLLRCRPFLLVETHLYDLRNALVKDLDALGYEGRKVGKGYFSRSAEHQVETGTEHWLFTR